MAIQKGLFLLLLPIATMAQEPSIERQTVLRNMLKHDCGACHGLTLKGGLGSSLLPNAIQNKSDDLLQKTILEGRAGTAMPPWKKFLSAQDALWLIKLLRNPNN